jgi:hypothetical protein
MAVGPLNRFTVSANLGREKLSSGESRQGGGGADVKNARVVGPQGRQRVKPEGAGGQCNKIVSRQRAG